MRRIPLIVTSRLRANRLTCIGSGQQVSVIEFRFGHGASLGFVGTYVPMGWPEAVCPPGSEDFESSAVSFPVKFFCSALGMSLCLPGWVRVCDVGAPG